MHRNFLFIFILIVPLINLLISLNSRDYCHAMVKFNFFEFELLMSKIMTEMLVRNYLINARNVYCASS